MEKCLVRAILTLALVAGVACGHSPTAPTAKAVLAVSIPAVAEVRTEAGYSYTLTVHAQNSGSAAATVTSVTVNLAAGGVVLGATSVLNPFSGKVPAAGSLDSRSITVTDDVVSHGYASTLTAVVAFTDDSPVSGTVSATTPLTVLPACCTISGTVTETSPTDTTPVPGATVTVTTSAGAGSSTVADGAGRYSLANVFGTMTLRASAPGYDDAAQPVTVVADRAGVDFRVNPVTLTRNDTYTGTVSEDSPVCENASSDGRKPCQKYLLPLHASETVEAVLKWDDPDPQSWTLALELVREPGTGAADRIAISRFSPGNTEHVSVRLAGGVMYSLRVLYPGSAGPQTPQAYTLNVRRGPS